MYTHSSIHLSIMYICVYITLHRSAAGTVLPSEAQTIQSPVDLLHLVAVTCLIEHGVPVMFIPLASFPSRSFVSDQLHCSDFPPGQCSALPCCIAINIALGLAHP